jgi:hypothetical protein
VADVIQDKLYLQGRRLDTSRLYIRNASDKPMKEPIPQEQINTAWGTLKTLIDEHKPILILTFGVNAFWITQLACGEDVPHKVETAKQLGEQFKLRIGSYSDNKVNIIPLLHVSIARGKFLEAHRDFVGDNSKSPNYFTHVGTNIADLLLAKFSDKPIWIELHKDAKV